MTKYNVCDTSGSYIEVFDIEVYKDAAEFEGRIAEKLVKDRIDSKTLRPKGCSWHDGELGHRVRKTACPPHYDIDNCPGFAMCCLYLARLAVEEEMANRKDV